ncbi:MAG: virulence factor TspB C-terminal domain-related protein [Georgfuchsia sp.]
MMTDWEKCMLFGVLITLFVLLHGNAHAAFPAYYQYLDKGWNFCGPSSSGCTPPTTQPGLSWSSSNSLADTTAQIWTGMPAGYSYSAPTTSWPTTQAGTSKSRTYKWVKSGSADYTAVMSASLNGCPSNYSYNGITASYSADGTTGMCRSSSLICPANSTLSGVTCSCNSGFVESGSSCVVSSCPAKGTNYSSGYYDIGTSPNAPAGSMAYLCAPDGCAVGFSGTSPAATSLVNGVAHYYAKGYLDYWGPGETCTPGSGNTPTAPSAAPATSSCPAGQFYAVVNGIGKCFDQAGQAQSSDPQKTTTTTNQKTVNGDGSTTITTTTTNNYTGGSSTTTITYPPGATVPDVPSTETKPQEETAQESICKTQPDLLQCMELGGIPTEETLGSQSVVPTALTPVSFSLNNACPADVPLPHGAVLSYQPTCNFLGGIRPIVLLLAWLAAGFIVLGARSDG